MDNAILKIKNLNVEFPLFGGIFQREVNCVHAVKNLSINIPKLPVCTTEHGIDILKKNFNILKEWKYIFELIPTKFKKSSDLKRTGISGIFAASLELTREGIITIMQKKPFDKLLIKVKK